MSLKPIYNFFVGRKLFYFNLIFFVNVILALKDKWTDGFGYFSCGLYLAIVVGVEGNKFLKGMGKKDE